MQLYLLLPGDTSEDTLNEANLLGETSFGVFWAGSALTTLMRMIDEEPDILPHIRIATDMSKRLFNIEEFLTTISKHQVRVR